MVRYAWVIHARRVVVCRVLARAFPDASDKTWLNEARRASFLCGSGRAGRLVRRETAEDAVESETMARLEERAELHKAIWGIADSLRGSVSGWEFKAYVLGTLFYRFISEKLESRLNADERAAGHANFVYGDLSDATAARAKKMVVDKLGYFISPSHLFRNVHAGAKDNADLNITLGEVFAEIESSANGTECEKDFKGLFTGMDFQSLQNLGATVDERNGKLVDLLSGIAKMKLGDFKDNSIDAFGDAYEYLMKMYASHAGKSGGEFFTPQEAFIPL